MGARSLLPRKAKCLEGFALSSLIKGSVVTGMTMAFKSEFLPKILPISEIWRHDAWISLMVSVMAKLEPIAEALNAYRVHAAQQTYIQSAGKIPKIPVPERARRFQGAAIRYEKAAQHIGLWEKCEAYQSAVKDLMAKAHNKGVDPLLIAGRFFGIHSFWTLLLFIFFIILSQGKRSDESLSR